MSILVLIPIVAMVIVHLHTDWHLYGHADADKDNCYEELYAKNYTDDEQGTHWYTHMSRLDPTVSSVQN